MPMATTKDILTSVSHSEYHVFVSSNFRGQAGKELIPDLSAKCTAPDDTPVSNI